MIIRKLKIPFFSALLVVITYVFYLNLFGKENTLVGLLFAVGSIFFLSNDFTGRLMNKFFSFLVINLSIGILSYVATTNIYIGLFINLIVLFFTTYIYMNDFKQPASFIFLMIYIYMYLIPVPIEKLPIRLFSIVFGVALIIFIQFICNRGKFDKIIYNSIQEVINNIDNQIESIIINNYNELNSIKINAKIRKLIISIKDYTNNNFKNDKRNYNKFNIALCLYRLNMQISIMSELKENESFKKDFLNDLKIQLKNINCFNQEKNSLNNVEESFYLFKNKYEKNRNIKIVDEIMYSLLILRLSLKRTTEYDENLKRIYINVNVPNINSLFYDLKNNFNINSLRFKYAIRISISMSLLIFVSQFFKYPNLKWLILSTYNVLQPYFEDSNKRGLERFKGVAVGAILYYIIFYFIDCYNSYLVVMLITFTGYFYFKEYRKKVMMTTILSISVASLTLNDAKILPFTRFFLVVLGILIAILVNKYLFPYKINDSIIELKQKYVNATNYILDEFQKVLNGKATIDTILYKSMERKKLECLLIENEKEEDKIEIETFIYHENLKMNEGKHNFLKYYYLKIKK